MLDTTQAIRAHHDAGDLHAPPEEHRDKFLPGAVVPPPIAPVKPARTAESPWGFESRLARTVNPGDQASRTTMVVGEVLSVHVAPGVVSGHRVDRALLDPLERFAGQACSTAAEVIHV